MLDAGLKAFGMDHGDPKVLDGGDGWFVSDEHITFGLAEGADVHVGDRVRVIPAHVDPTVRSTSGSTSSTATRWSRSGTSTSAAGSPTASERRRGRRRPGRGG